MAVKRGKKDTVAHHRSFRNAIEAPNSGHELIGVALLTGGFDRPYAFGLAMALASEDLRVEVVGSDEIDSPEMHATLNLQFLNLFGNRRPDVGVVAKVFRVLRFYARLLKYVATSAPRIVHILWNNKLQYFDRTLLMLIYKSLGKKIVLTAHNVNVGKRDANDSWLNRVTLRRQYRVADHIFVHTEKSKTELIQDFGVKSQAVTVIPFGINNSVPDTELTAAQARGRLRIGPKEKTILFFGAIRPYKGLEYLAAAFQKIASKDSHYRLIIAGEAKKGCEQYIKNIHDSLSVAERAQVLERLEFVPDEETELYFKAADVLVLPYTHVFQSGVLFLSYTFGLPVIASDVGSFREDIVEGKTGFVCQACNAEDLSRTIEIFFDSDLFKNLDGRRSDIRNYAIQRNSWKIVGEKTRLAYQELTERS